MANTMANTFKFFNAKFANSENPGKRYKRYYSRILFVLGLEKSLDYFTGNIITTSKTSI